MNFLIIAWSVLKSYWKIIVPVILVVLIAGTVWGMSKRIDSLKEQRDELNTKFEIASKQSESLMADIRRLNKIIIQRQQQSAKLEKSYGEALDRINALSKVRPDVRSWVDTPLPDGLWAATRDTKGTTPSGSTGADNRGGDGAENKRPASGVIPLDKKGT